MKLKKFIAASLQEGKSTVLKELGPDAVILSTRQIKKYGNLEGDFVEIVAAIDDSLINKGSSGDKTSGRVKKFSDTESTEHIDVEKSKIYFELNNIKQMVEELNEKLKYKYSASLGQVFGKLYKVLINAGYTENFALEIIGNISSENYNISFEDAFYKAKEMIVSNITIGNFIEKKEEPQLIAFLGPSGSGKTTTLIKLAVIYKLIHKSEVFIISADAHKIGGAEHLQLLSSVAGLPYKAVFSSEELKNTILEKSSSDFIFIDTYGASPNEDDILDEINGYLSLTDFSYKYLVIPANFNYQAFNYTLEKFKKVNYNSVIISKIDEINEIGSIFTIIAKEKIPLSYITKGKKIPEDIEPAEREKLLEIVLPESLMI